MAKRFDQEAVRKIFVELVGNYMTASETKSEIASQIAEIVAGAPESLDTLKEIADWIENHAESAAEMNSEIKANTEGISSLETLVSTLETQVSALETEVPTKTSDLTNDSGFITSSAIPTKVSAFENDSGYITSADVPTKMSELTDDVGYAKESDIPTKVSELTNDSGYAVATDVDSELSKIDKRIDDIVSEGGEPNVIDTIKRNGEELEVTDKTVDIEVPTKTSELENDSGFITESGDGINPNILRGTNSCTVLSEESDDSWSRGEWYLSNSNVETTPIEITDAPICDITQGWHFLNTDQYTNAYIAQSGLPFKSGTYYNLSVYARGSGDMRIGIGLSIGHRFTVSNNDWELFSYGGRYSEDSGDISFQININGEADIEICGMKLEEVENSSSAATPWCPSYWDMENKNTLVYDEESETMYY